MADLTYTVDVNTTPAITGLTKLQDKLGKLSGQFGSMQTALAGLFLGATIGSAMKYADTVSDLSKATGIAIENILGLNSAVVANGGDSDTASKGLLKLVQNIGDANAGSASLQYAFREVGVSLKDLRSLSEQDILKKTISGLGQLDDVSKRVALTSTLLSKGFKGVDLKGLSSDYDAATIASLKYADSVKAAGAVHDKLDAALNTFQLKLLSSMAPLADFLEKLKPEQIEQFIDAVIKISAALGGLIVVTKVLSAATAFVTGQWALFGSGAALLSSGITQVGAKLTAIGGVFRFVGTAAAEAFTLMRGGFTTISGAISSLRWGWAAFAGAFSETGGIIASIFGGFAIGAGAVIAGLAKITAVVIAVAAAMYALATAIDLVFDTKIIDNFTGAIGRAYQATKELIGLGDKPMGPIGHGGYTEGDIKRMKDYSAELAKQKEHEAEQVDAFKKRRQELELISISFKNYTRDLNIATAQEAAFVGMNVDQVEIIKAQTAIFAKAADEVKKLQDAKKMLTKEESVLSATYDAQIAKINALADAGAAEAGAAIQNLQTRKALEADRLQNIENMTKAIDAQIARQQTLGDAIRSANDKKVDVAFEGSQATKNPLQKQMAQIQEDARKGALEAGRTFAAGFEGMDLSIEQAKELADGLDAIAKSYKGIADAQTTNLEASRSWEAGWKNASDAYLENMTNAATKAGSMFGAITNGMDAAIDKFVTTGKFSFSDFASSIIQDMIKIELKAAASKMLSGITSGIGSFVGGLLGFADGGDPPVGKASIVGERGPELFIPKTAGTIIPNSKMGSGSSTVAASAPAPVVNNTYITNNISAVDAKSVAQLFAENRKTLLGTVRLAEKEMPYGR